MTNVAKRQNQVKSCLLGADIQIFLVLSSSMGLTVHCPPIEHCTFFQPYYHMVCCALYI